MTSCLAKPPDLDDDAAPRTEDFTESVSEMFDLKTLWKRWGIVGDVVPFTTSFPRADIYELLSPDLLHQIIKGVFKDHLVSWVSDYLHTVHDTEKEAQAVLDDIDRRYVF